MPGVSALGKRTPRYRPDLLIWVPLPTAGAANGNVPTVTNSATSPPTMGWSTPAGAASGTWLFTPTAVKTANYTAAAGDFVPVDTTSTPVTVTLPTTPPDKTLVAIEHVIQGGSNAVTVACGGSDVIDRAGGSTSTTMPIVAEAMVLQYRATGAIWLRPAGRLSVAGLDTRYAALYTPLPAVVTTAFAATVTPAVTANVRQTLNIGALTANITIANPTGSPVDGQVLEIRMLQDATGGRTVSFGTNFAFGTDVTSALIPTAASSKWEMTFIWNATDSKWRALAIARGF